MSRPFHNKEFTFHQPDGTPIKLYGTGNQNAAVFEDEKGYVVVRDPATGTYQYADLNASSTDFAPVGAIAGQVDPDGLGLEKHLRPSPGAMPVSMAFAAGAAAKTTRWQQRIEERRAARRAAREAAANGLVMAPPSEETVGTYVGICVLIDFSDEPATIPRDQVDAFCNDPGYSGFGNNGSVRDYFLDVSHGRLDYSNLVTDYYRAAHPRSHYTDETIADGQRARELIVEALTHLRDTGFDFSSLTTDSQGFIRALNVFYAGTRVNNWSKGLWPHSWSLAEPFQAAPGRRFFDYQFTDMTEELTLGTFCHENGHMICDFPDLYDYGRDGFKSNGIGDYCLMCAGGRDDRNPVRVAAYLNRMAGWAQDVTAAVPGLAGTLAADRDEFLIHARNGDEYFIVEHRRPEGRDAELPASGLAVWHVDHEGSNENQQGTAARHYECALEQADGLRQLELGQGLGDPRDLFSAGTRDAFGDATSPNSRWWDGSPSGFEIGDIGPLGAEIAYRIPDTDGGDDLVEEKSSPNLAIPDNVALGVGDTIAVDAKGTAAFIEVAVDIGHSFRGDLVVALRAPSGAVAVLHNRSGGRADDIKRSWNSDDLAALGHLLGEDLRGDWRLEVSDRAPIDTGVLNSWSLTIRPATSAPDQIGEAPGVAIPDNDPNGITRSLAASGDGTVATVAVMVDITHSFIRDLVVTLVSPAGQRVDLHDRAGGNADNIIQTYTTVTTPALEALHGTAIAGVWQLQVSDREGQDTGKLNRWAVTFQPLGS